MAQAHLHTIAQLRILVAYLGERTQHNWWSSVFFGAASPSFLNPVFVRTTFLAQYHGAQQAANLVHDEFIGIGGRVFHLFRLPEAMEQELHDYLSDPELTERLKIVITSPDRALQALLELAGDTAEVKPETGPLHIGATEQISQRNLWHKAARYYYAAFVQGTRTYPYLASA